MTTPTGAQAPYILGPSEGEVAPWFSATVTLKASTPTLGVSEVLIGAGDEPPIHAHTREDEWFYVLEGEVTFHLGATTMLAVAGSFISVPREVPHTLTIESEMARLLVLNVPGGEERMFQLAPQSQDDVERMFEEYGLRLLGPHPRDSG